MAIAIGVNPDRVGLEAVRGGRERPFDGELVNASATPTEPVRPSKALVQPDPMVYVWTEDRTPVG